MRRAAVIISGVILAISGRIVAQATPVGISGAWRVVSMDGASPPGRTGVTMDFGLDGRLSGGGPCNRYHAAYRIETDRIVFSAGASTRMFCGEEIMRAERRFMDMLGGGASWRISGNILSLASDRGVRITATRAGARAPTLPPKTSF